MSDMRESKTTAPQVPGQTRGPERTTEPGGRAAERTPEPTAWAGWVVFGAMMMILLGAFHGIAGLVALFEKSYYLVGSNGLLVHVNYTAWGWAHIILGLVAVGAGYGLMRGEMWGRIVGVCVAALSALANLAFLAAYPVWGLTMITLDFIVIYAIIAHGKEVKALD
ncbi:MAG: DUF7144 family membrane protein [Nocardioidaceae bacterium]